MDKIGFGGGCHWCTEAVFLSLKGVCLVEQGWIAAAVKNDIFSEAVIVHFDPAEIDLQTLVEIHLHTHSSRSNHAMRSKYRSAVYVFNEEQRIKSTEAICNLHFSVDAPFVTQVLLFGAFRSSAEQFSNYYYKNTAKPFCETHIHPKIKILQERFSRYYQSK